MELTRITIENMSYFAHLFPDEVLTDDRLVKLGALSEGMAVSGLAMGISDGMARIRWLYTEPGSRRQGGASFLLEEAAKLLEGLGLQGIEVDYRSEEEELEDFLMERDFLLGEEISLYRVPLKELLYSNRAEEMLARRSPEMVTCSLDHTEILKPLAQFLKANKVDPTFAEGIAGRYSFATMNSHGEITDVILMAEAGEDLHINYLIGGGSPQGMLHLVAAVYDRLMEDRKENGDLVFCDRSGAAVSFIERLNGNDEETYRVPGLMYAVKLFGQTSEE